MVAALAASIVTRLCNLTHSTYDAEEILAGSRDFGHIPLFDSDPSLDS